MITETSNAAACLFEEQARARRVEVFDFKNNLIVPRQVGNPSTLMNLNYPE